MSAIAYSNEMSLTYHSGCIGDKSVPTTCGFLRHASIEEAFDTLQRAGTCFLYAINTWQDASRLVVHTHFDCPFSSAGANVKYFARILQWRVIISALEQDFEDLVL